MESPDLSDPDVRELLDSNHKPEEITARRMDDALATVAIACEKCGEPYPCPTRIALREDERKRRERVQEILRRSRQQAMRANPRRNCGDPRPHPEHSYTGFAAVFYCPGVSHPELGCGGPGPHDGHLWTPVNHGWEHWCPGVPAPPGASTTPIDLDWYDKVTSPTRDCDYVTQEAHAAHAWKHKGERFWCPGG